MRTREESEAGSGILEARREFQERLGWGSMLEAAMISAPQIGFMTLKANFQS